MPTFWLALVALYIFFFRLNWLPGTRAARPRSTTPPPSHTGLYTVDALLAGQWSTFVDALQHLVLPGLVLAAFNVGLLTRYTRSAVLEVIDDDYVRAARAKGLPERIVVLAPRPARGAAADHHRRRPRVRERHDRHRARRERSSRGRASGSTPTTRATTLDLPAIMGVSLFVGDRLHHRQLHRRRALRRDRPADADRMSVAGCQRARRAQRAAGSCPRGSTWRQPARDRRHRRSPAPGS